MRSNITPKVEFLVSQFNNLFHRKNIVCNIGHNGIYLVAIKNRKIIEKLYLSDLNPSEGLKEFRSGYMQFFGKYSNYYVTFLIDHKRCRYQNTTMPVFNTIFKSNNFNKFINENFKTTELVSYNVYDKFFAGEDIWKVNIASVLFTAPINELHRYILEKSMKYAGTYFLFLEFETIINKILRKAKIKANDDLVIFVCLTITSHIKIIVKRKKQIIEQKSLPIDKTKSIEYVAGQIQQAINDIISQKSKFVSENKLKIHIVSLVSNQLSKNLENIKFDKAQIHCIKPSLVYKEADDDNLYQEDTLLSIFDRSNSYLASNWQLRTITSLNIAKQLIFKPAILLILYLIYKIGLIMLDINTMNQKISMINKEYYNLSSEYRSALDKYPNLRNASDKIELFNIKSYIVKQESIKIKALKTITNLNLNDNMKIKSLKYKMIDPHDLSQWDKEFIIKLNIRYRQKLSEYTKPEDSFKEIIKQITVNFNKPINYEIKETEIINKKRILDGYFVIKGKVRDIINAK